jgi:hypothetical protein
MALTVEELKEILADRIDPDDVTEALELSTEQLLNAFEDELIAKRYKFEDYEEQYEREEI